MVEAIGARKEKIAEDNDEEKEEEENDAKEEDEEERICRQFIPKIRLTSEISKDDLNIIYHIGGFVVAKIQKQFSLCAKCRIALLPRTDFMSDHSRLTFIKDYTGVSLTHLSPELFEQVFVKAEIVFRTSIKDHSKNIVKWMCDRCIRARRTISEGLLDQRYICFFARVSFIIKTSIDKIFYIRNPSSC